MYVSWGVITTRIRGEFGSPLSGLLIWAGARSLATGSSCLVLSDYFSSIYPTHRVCNLKLSYLKKIAIFGQVGWSNLSTMSNKIG